jgi:hypothetical protein
MKKTLLFSLLLAWRAFAAPPTVPEFVAALERGTISPEFPKLDEKCQTPGLAPAFASFVAKHPDRTRELLRVVKDGFRSGNCPVSFGKFAAEVRAALHENDEYKLLDDLPQVLPRAAQPVAPVVRPTVLADAERQQIATATVVALDSRLTGGFVVLALIGLATAALFAMQLMAQKRGDASAAERLQLVTGELNAVFAGLKTALETQQATNTRAENMTNSWLTRLPPRVLSAEDLQPLRESVEGMRHELSLARERKVPPQPVTPAPAPTPVPDQVALEREMLEQAWRQFQDRKDLVAAFENAARDEAWKKIEHALLDELPKHVPDDLKGTFDAVVAPARDYHNLIIKISLVPRIVSGALQRLEHEAHEVRRTRELVTLLDSLQHSSTAAERLHFRTRSWITDTFLGFADLYLQRYQQAQLERRGEALQKGASIVRQVLGAAAVEPIDLTLGQTTFDSTRHVGRSTANDPRFSDGIVVGVVRNGFMEGGQLVIRQPEVIVNRTR